MYQALKKTTHTTKSNKANSDSENIYWIYSNKLQNNIIQVNRHSLTNKLIYMLC